MAPTIRTFAQHKTNGVPLVMLTAYDATSARLAASAGVNLLLVGDSLGMVVQGHSTTLPVTLEHIIYHTQLVVRGAPDAFIIADMPFMSYNVSPEQALSNAARCIQDGGAQGIKLEGGARMASTIRRLVESGIPVLAHIGLTPQSVHSLGGWRVQGKTEAGARALLADALAVQAAGAFAVILELVPAPLAERITAELSIPTIGIGAGVGCDGQVQVLHDILGLIEGFTPKHAHIFAEGGALLKDGIMRYKAAVEARDFPTAENAPSIDDDVLRAIYGAESDT